MAKTYLIDKSLCSRCGACFAADKDAILSKDVMGFPILDGTTGVQKKELLNACTGRLWNYRELLDFVHGVDYPYVPSSPDKGSILRIGIAYAKKSDMREQGQSGGVSTTLLKSGLTSGLIDSVLGVRRPDQSNAASDPFKSEPFIARNADELRQAAGSKYTICSSLELLPELEATSEAYALSLLPCQTAGFQQMRKLGQVSADKCKLIIGPFCGFNMEHTMGHEFASALEVDSKEVRGFANRAGKFPGQTRLELASGKFIYVDRTAHRPLYRMFSPDRCFTCTDFTNELADLSIADCWNRGPDQAYEYPEGAAWVLVRTQRGDDYLQAAIQSGELEFIETPHDANEKYWVESFRHRKVRAFNRVHLDQKAGKPVPEFDHPVPGFDSTYLRSDQTDLYFRNLFKHPTIRKLFLKYWLSACRDGASSSALAVKGYLSMHAFNHHAVLYSPLRLFFGSILVWLKASKFGRFIKSLIGKDRK